MSFLPQHIPSPFFFLPSFPPSHSFPLPFVNFFIPFPSFPKSVWWCTHPLTHGISCLYLQPYENYCITRKELLDLLKMHQTTQIALEKEKEEKERYVRSWECCTHTYPHTHTCTQHIHTHAHNTYMYLHTTHIHAHNTYIRTQHIHTCTQHIHVHVHNTYIRTHIHVHTHAHNTQHT